MLTNDGDYALLKVILKSISKHFPNVEFTLPLWNYDDISDLKEWNVKVFKANWPMMPYGIVDMIFKFVWATLYRLLGVTPLDKEVRAIAESDVAITPVRDMLVLGSLGRVTQFLYTLFRIYIPKFMGKPTMFYASDVRPGKGLMRTFLLPWLRLVFGKLDVITVRDKDSLRNLVEAGVDLSKVKLTADPVFLLESAKEKEALKILESEGVPVDHRPLIGLSLNPLVYRPKRISRSSQREIILTLTDLVNFLIERLGATVVFIPRVTIFNESDMIYAESIKAVIKHKDKFFVLSKRYKPEQIRAIIGSMDFFIAMAFHALIHVVCMGVPLVAVDYGRKVLEAMRGFGLEELVIPAKELTPDTLKNKVELAWSMREQIKSKLLTNISKYKVLAEVNTKAFKNLLKNHFYDKGV